MAPHDTPEKKPFRTRLPSCTTSIRAPSVHDNDTPRSDESESEDKVDLRKATKSPDSTTAEEPQKGLVKDVTVTKWADYTKKYGFAYQLSNGSTGVLFNDETKIIYSPIHDKAHYFNGIDMVLNDFENFSTKPLGDYSSDLRKKVKILSYLRKVLKRDEAKVSLTVNKPTECPNSVVYVKKWNKVDDKLIFKLSSKLMQIIKSNKNEILLKYDVGQADLYKPNGDIKSTTLSHETKKYIFSGSKSLSQKLELIETLLTQDQAVPKYAQNKAKDMNMTTYTASKIDNVSNATSMLLSTPTKDWSITHSLRRNRFKKNYGINTNQSTCHTPFKELNTKTSSNIHVSSTNDFRNYASKTNKE